LVVEDEQDVRNAIERSLRRAGYEVLAVSDGQEAIDRLSSNAPVDLVLTDLEMPRAGGAEVLSAAQRQRVPVIVLTGSATVENAVMFMKQGAANFLAKPFTPDTLTNVIRETLGTRLLSSDEHHVVGAEAPFRKVLNLIESVAETDVTVLVTGESGTGKEVVAKAIHASSRRASGPFVAVNCGAIPEALLETEMFGHAKGAFTGATQARAGRFQAANGGTIFLDEIGDMPLAFQVKLLRVLQERRFEVVGESTSKQVDVRVIAATHKNLRQMVSQGTFREDLFYRINVFEVSLPPLRERKGDIAVLVSHFIKACNARHGRSVAGASQGAIDALSAYGWPGNIRELGNVVERMVVLKRAGELEAIDVPALGESRAADLLSHPELPALGLDLRQTIASLEDSLIEQALSRTGGNRNAAAQLLGLNRTTLVEKLKRKR
jgi:DNA-binding NtrC family response regulator